MKLKKLNVVLFSGIIACLLIGSSAVIALGEKPTLKLEYSPFFTPEETLISIQLNITFHGIRTRIRKDIHLYYSVNKPLADIEEEGHKIIDPSGERWSNVVMTHWFFITTSDLITIKADSLKNGDTIRFKVRFEWGTALVSKGFVDSGIKVIKYRTGGYIPENPWWLNRTFQISAGVIGGIIILSVIYVLRKRMRR